MTLKRPRLKSSLPPRATLSPLHPAPNSEPASAPVATGATAPGTIEAGGRAAISVDRTLTSKRRLQLRSTPLAVLPPPLQAGVRKVFDLRRFLLVLLLTSVVLLLPRPPGLSEEGQRALALFVFTGSILSLEPVSLPIAALLVPICQIALGIDTAAGAFAPFGQPVLFLILGSLFLAEALRKHGLTRRVALYTIVLSQGRVRMLLLGLMMVSALLSMWVLNTATVAVLIPVAISIVQHVRPNEKAARSLEILILGIAISSSIGGMGTVMGSGENAIASGLLAQVVPFHFLDWLKYGGPLVIMLIPLSWILLLRALPIGQVLIDTDPAVKELARLGNFSGPEREIMTVLALSVALWIAGSTLESLFHLPSSILSSAVVAIGAVVLLSIEEVVDWNDLKGVNWGVFFVIGAGLTLGDALDKTGASQWMANMLSPMLQGWPYEVVLVALVLLAFFITQLVNNITLGAIVAPVLITLSEASGIPPTRLVLPTIMALALAFMLPGASSRMTLAAVTGAVEHKNMFKAGLFVGIPSVVVLILFYFVMSLFGLV